MSDANLAERPGVPDELLHEFLGRRLRKLLGERDDEEVSHAELANERDLVLSCGQQMRRVFGPRDLHRVRIEGGHDRCAVGGMGVTRGSRDDGLMSAMDPVEDTDGEEKGTGESLARSEILWRIFMP